MMCYLMRISFVLEGEEKKITCKTNDLTLDECILESDCGFDAPEINAFGNSFRFVTSPKLLHPSNIVIAPLIYMFIYILLV